MTPSQAKYWKRRMPYHRLLVPFFAIMFLAGGVPRVAAQDYPTRSVTLIVPFTPAGATDILGRMAAAALEARLGKSFVVENRPGAGQQIGVNAVARAAPDGYTLLVATSSALAINPSLYKKLSYDPVKDFQPIAMLAHIPFLLVVNNDLPVKRRQRQSGQAELRLGRRRRLAPSLWRTVQDAYRH